MRISLQIDGDASGATKAAQDASGAVSDLGKLTDDVSKAIEAGFAKATGAVGDLKSAGQAAGAANDNAAGSALGLAGKLSQVAAAAGGADSALAKGAAGAVSFASGISGLTKTVGAFGLIGGVIGIAITAGSTFYDIINRGSVESSKHLDDTTTHINAANNAYNAAAKAAGAYYVQKNNIAILDSNQNLRALRADQQNNSASTASRFTPSQVGAFNGSIPGEDVSGGLAGALFPDQTNDRFKAFQSQIDALNASIAAGTPEWEKFGQSVAAAGNAMLATNPAIFDASRELLKISDARIKGSTAISEEERNLRLYGGTATKADLASRGLTQSANDSAGAFDRLAKSIDRQSAAQEAEAQTAGLSAGAAAKLRTEFTLTEAAKQASGLTAAQYAENLAKIPAAAERAGEAVQKLAQAKLQSDTAFASSQIGRNTIDASVADQLKGAFGNNADQNSAIANTIRFNEQMKDLKGTVTDVANGAFTDLRTAIQGGATAMQALGTVSINVLNKIIDKLANKVLDNGISNLFGAFLGGSGSTGLGATSTGAAGVGGIGGLYDSGGYTGDGGKYQVAGVVHKGEYVFDQGATNRIGLSTLARLHKGYADGGLVGSPAPWSTGSHQSSRGQDSAPALNVAIGVSVDDEGNLQAYVKRVSQSTSVQAFNDGMSSYIGSPAHIDHTAQASKLAQSYRLMK